MTKREEAEQKTTKILLLDSLLMSAFFVLNLVTNSQGADEGAIPRT